MISTATQLEWCAFLPDKFLMNGAHFVTEDLMGSVS
jgi:hypothetical protein